MAIAFDAAGAGGSGSAGVPATYTHTASGADRAVIVVVSWTCVNGSGTPTRTATYGGVSMSSLGQIGVNNDTTNTGFSHLEFFGLLNPLTGAQTVSVSVTRTGMTSLALLANSASYTGVLSFGAVTTGFGTETGTALSQSISSAVGERVFAAFQASGAAAFSQTQRFTLTSVLAGDAAGAASVTFTATRTTGVDYGEMGVRLTPSMSSFFPFFM